MGLAKKTKITALQHGTKRLAQQIEQHVQWVTRARDKVSFGPTDLTSATSFLAAEREQGAGPFSQYFRQEQAANEAKEAEWRVQGREIMPDDGGDGGDGGNDSGDDEREAARKKKKSKRQSLGKIKQLPNSNRAFSASAMTSHEDHVEELRMSDLDDD